MKEKNIYEKLKNNIINYIKNNYKFILFWIIFYIIFFYRIDYEIYMPGGVDDLSKRISVEDAYSTSGKLYMTHVSGMNGTVGTYLISKVLPSWDAYSLESEGITREEKDKQDDASRLDLINGLEISKLVALEEANIEYKKDNEKLIVYYIFNEANTSLEIGDEILEVNGIKVSNTTSFQEKIKDYKENDKLTIKVKRNGKEKYVDASIINYEDKLIIGILITNTYNIESDIDINIKYDDNESGSSGGLMTTLYIYNSLVKEDITNGYKIAGTGTIEEDGSVGEIGGVKYKLAAAEKKKCDYFLVPSNNYEEALKEKEDNNYKIKLIKAENFKQVLEELNNL